MDKSSIIMRRLSELTSQQREDLAGIASCGCWHHAEQGIPCEHDLAVACVVDDQPANDLSR